MNDVGLSCRDERRRETVRTAHVFGLDYVEVSDDQTTLTVTFLGKAPPAIAKENVRISGGRRIRDIHVTGLAVTRSTGVAPGESVDDSMSVRVDKAGDFSTYTLSLIQLDEQGHATDQPMHGFDPRYAAVDFSFRAGCPSDLDCKPATICPPPQRAQPEINYLAKDYASFRQLILDRLALIMPGWQETHVPDIGITLVELLAYVGDYLSYYQDAVATEAYLGTARQRISVRRHARLVDYAMHEGCNARAWITIDTDADATLDLRQVFFITSFPQAPDDRVLQPRDFAKAPAGTFEVFEPLVADPSQLMRVYKAHSEIHFYTWGNGECCLAAGTTRATLIDSWVPAEGGKPVAAQPDAQANPPAAGAAQPPSAQVDVPRVLVRDVPLGQGARSSDEPPGMVRALNLAVGDVLIFEEVIGPKTANPDDADPQRRQAVRLTGVTPTVDPLYHPADSDYGQPLVEIEWCSEDALAFPLCISAQGPPPDCKCVDNISVARGNVVLVDHGASVAESLDSVTTKSTTQRCPTDCEPGEIVVEPNTFCPTLKQRPLTFSQPLPPCGCASAFVAQDPRQALPDISLTGTQTTVRGDVVSTWSPKGDLLESGSDDADFVVEVDNDGYAHLRFGDGDLGRRAEAGTAFQAAYRIGNGSSGNVGAETIAYLVFRQTTEGVGKLVPRNPLAATGGTDPEPVQEVKLFAPSAFRKVLERAITADDYGALASDNARRLAQRAALEGAAALNTAEETTASPMAPVDDLRRSEEEEPESPPAVPPDICLTPFRKLQSAKATLRWTGSWYEALVAVDPAGTEETDDELLEEIAAYLEPYRRMGHDLDVKPAQYVGLDLALTVCVLPHYLRGHVEAALLDVFSNRVLADGRLGFFHPDNLSFGDDIYVSRIVAAAQAVVGVQSVQVTRLERYEIGEPALGVEDASEEVPSSGVLPLGPLEIARLDNDPSFPENGRLQLDLRGGR